MASCNGRSYGSGDGKFEGSPLGEKSLGSYGGSDIDPSNGRSYVSGYEKL